MNQAQQQQLNQTKSNKGQHTRKVQHFKRKHRKSNKHWKTISNETYDLSEQADTREMFQKDLTLFMSPSLSMKKTFYPLHILSSIDPSIFLSNYSTMSNTNFQQMLSALFVAHYNINLYNEFLDTDEKVTFTRQLFELINKLNYIKLQEEQWIYYYHLGITEGIWNGRVSKKMALVNSMYYTYGRGKTIIEQRRKYFKPQLEEITCKLQEHIQQAPSTIDTNKLMTIVTDLINKDHYQLRVELERRKQILKFDAKDHHLVEIFYQLKPRQTEIHSAKIIWKANHDEQALRYEIAMFKSWFSSTNGSTSATFQDLQLTKMNDIFTHLILNKQLSSTTNSVEQETTSNAKFVQDSIQQTISTAEEMAQSYQQKSNQEKQKILNNQEKFKKPPTVNSIITAIENRQINMVQRAQHNINQQLKSIFQMNVSDHNPKY